MKKSNLMEVRYIIVFLLIFFMPRVDAQSITNPLQHFATAHNLASSAHLKNIEADVNGDGVNDVVLAYEAPNPDREERIARAKEGGVIEWTVYIKGATGNYIVSTGIEKSGKLDTTAHLRFAVDRAHVGQLSEISHFAFVTFDLTDVKGETPTLTVLGYTWEGDHLKEQELAKFLEPETNAIYNKYLAKEKRTTLTVQDVTP